MQAETRLLPAPAPAIQKAIEAGKGVVTEAVAKGIEEHENPIVATGVGAPRYMASAQRSHSS